MTYRGVNALAETIIGLYKAELITLEGPWRTVEDVELATLGWVDWWNHRRLLWPLGGVPPTEYEAKWAETNTRTTLNALESTSPPGHGVPGPPDEAPTGLATPN